MTASSSDETAAPNDAAVDEGRLTSPTLLAWLRRTVSDTLGEPEQLLPHDKMGLLLPVLERCGAAAVMEIGLTLRNLPANPVFNAIERGASVPDVLARWMLLERFGHSRNYTKALDQGADPTPWISLEHLARDGGPVHPVNDLFLWGLLVALIERAGFQNVTCRLGNPTAAGRHCYRNGQLISPLDAKLSTSKAILTWSDTQRTLPASTSPSSAAPAPTSALTSAASSTSAASPTISASLQDRLSSLFANDLLYSWKLAEAAQQLSVSTRDLQRKLRSDGTSFSELLQKTRVDHARALLEDSPLTLTEVAFSAGFADLAHFSRLFRRYLEVPPSTYRELRRPTRS